MWLQNLLWVQRVQEIDSKILDITNLVAKACLNKKATEIIYKISDTSFITTPEFDRLTKNKFWCKSERSSKSLASKSQVDNTVVIAEKNRDKVSI